MEATLNNCPNCNADLYSAVSYCPYCGAVVHGTEAKPPAHTELGAGKSQPELETKQKRKSEIVQELAFDSVAAKLEVQSVAAEVPITGGANQAEPEPHQAERSAGQSIEGTRGRRSNVGGKVVFALFALLVIAGGVYLMGGVSREPGPCDVALTQAAGLLGSGNVVDARGHAVMAIASCNGEERIKARDMLATVDKGIAAQAACERSFRQIASLISDRRLLGARSAFDELDTACVNSGQGKDLREKIDAGQAEAVAAGGEVRQQITAGDLKAARDALNHVTAANREYQDLPALRQELKVATDEQEAAERAASAVSPQSEPAPTMPSYVKQLPTQESTTTQSAMNAQAEAVNSLLRDAENAMRQLKFDAAKTYVESARRIDPRNPHASALAQRIRERELQYLRDETSIR